MDYSQFISKDELNDIVCSNIKKYRNKSGITQLELSEKINISHEYLRQLESAKGQKNFAFYTLYKIALVLDIPLNDFTIRDTND